MKLIEDLRHLFIHQIKDRYDSETQQVEVLQQLKTKVHSIHLKRVLENCENHAQKHLTSLDNLFSELQENGVGDICECSLGVITEMEKIIERSINPVVTDMAILSAVKQLHSNDLSGYHLILMYAHQVHDETIIEALEQMLKNERDLDILLDETIHSIIEKEAVYML
ncbi:YciE/YciF ferroxidase family protein [Flammeovirga kamogawensis]|uniref:DUF892 family protein n=1 Tax=Flammeovirga kamogawensis TaxID=373891 RepID=A0ABX8GUT5_9BACT|nr:DUF892 family protein [Flammeovirga kamogawensis]MBB6459963.1 ferritin-like metal-binding protein YciE [Flammeovirga kamogawensis]QWG06987.1 DUF892 family protein [Flammeovirga kamogawensis]TRX68807.1 DUF892 family protein [Flammeovirga kamogawensis]